MFKGHFSALQKAPYRTLKWAISQAEMGNIRTQNVSFRTMLWGILKDEEEQNRPHNAVFNIPLHLFRENILSKFCQEKL